MDTPIGTNSEQRERRRARITRRAQGFWSSDRSLTVLLVLLVANIFIVPLAQFATWGRLSGRAILSLIIISGLIATVRDRRIILLAVALTVVSVVVGWEDAERPNLYLHLFNNLYSWVFTVFSNLPDSPPGFPRGTDHPAPGTGIHRGLYAPGTFVGSLI
jgi:hypothetical protein